MDPASLTTAQLLTGWHEGDPSCLERLVERNLSWLRAHVGRRLGPELRGQAETVDYVQDAMVEFLRYGPRFVVESDGQFRGLLLKIVENSLRKKHRWYRAARREVARERPLPPTTVLRMHQGAVSDRTPSEVADRHEREAWVRLAMEFLSDEDQEILVLRLWKELSFPEIADRLGTSANTVRMRHHRALRRLADQTWALRRFGDEGSPG